MSRMKKAISNPRAFVADAWTNINSRRTLKARIAAAKASNRKIAVLVGFSSWKTWMRDFLPDREVVFLGHSPRVPEHILRLIPEFGDVEVYAWSYKFPKLLEQICSEADIPLSYVEDGFIRSFGLGASKTTPMSLVFDRKAMHFDRQEMSDLEGILASYDFAADAQLMCRAEKMIEDLKSKNVSKYNGLGHDMNLRSELGIDEKEDCILVIGQVEDDLSLAYGMKHLMSGNDLVLRAAMENPSATILYRPHPESRLVAKKHYSNPKDVSHFAHIVPEEASLHACFAAANRVYAMTSLAGFEALLHDLPVKVFGCPFYAGWGVTEDVDENVSRRTRTLTVQEIFAAAYILYPKYWRPVTAEEMTAEDALRTISVIRTHVSRVSSAQIRRESDQISVTE